MKNPYISIIIPVHNAEQYIDECLKSVLNQGDHNIEVLLIENGSTDNSVEICRRYSSADDRIRFYVSERKGVSFARNIGINSANGEYIIFLDADDMLQPGSLNIIEENTFDKLDILIMNYTRTYPSFAYNNEVKKVDKNLLAKAILHFSKYCKKLDDIGADEIAIWTCWGKCFRKELLLDNKVYFPENITHSEDTAFYFHAVCSAENIFFMDSVIYYYRENASSVTTTGSGYNITNNIKLIHYFERIREANCEIGNMDQEFYNFYAQKTVESFFLFGDKFLNLIREDTIIKNSIYKAQANNIIVGRRNQMKYYGGLSYIRIRLFLLSIRKRINVR